MSRAPHRNNVSACTLRHYKRIAHQTIDEWFTNHQDHLIPADKEDVKLILERVHQERPWEIMEDSSNSREVQGTLSRPPFTTWKEEMGKLKRALMESLVTGKPIPYGQPPVNGTYDPQWVIDMMTKHNLWANDVAVACDTTPNVIYMVRRGMATNTPNKVTPTVARVIEYLKWLDSGDVETPLEHIAKVEATAKETQRRRTLQDRYPWLPKVLKMLREAENRARDAADFSQSIAERLRDEFRWEDK